MNKTIVYGAIIIALSLFALKATAQESLGNFQEETHDREIMTQIILENLTVWVRPTDGSPIYHRSCRDLVFGCEEQITTFVDYLYEIAFEQDIDPWILAALVWHESRFNPFAESSAGAIGLFQLLRRGVWSRGLPFIRSRWYMERCRRELGACQYRSMRRAIFWLTSAVEHYGSVERGLRLYNSGHCDGPRRYPRAIFSIHRNFLARAERIRTEILIPTTQIAIGGICFDQNDVGYNSINITNPNDSLFMCSYQNVEYLSTEIDNMSYEVRFCYGTS